ncbi:LuxR family transcriptional regulator [Oerskovia sp. Root918]|uniref:Transcriptional regulatory protein LiaR n=1 Tax=Oerskovia enterophila TaxID=43678 RepID=A0A163SQ52_9CELL|nr:MULTISPECIES: response regulator transcription factor [Oerskovia]KRD40432.1 LuxR family transcriptional regulator [Oerskovia sp. Root918]KZM36653.1 transcriptional regulatory protein LiaR [Oerskovia enterophila]
MTTGPEGSATIRVVLTDDHPVVRAGLRAVVDAEGDMEVVDELATAEELVRRVGAGLEADVVLLDLRFGDGRMGGAQAAREVVRLGGPPVLILTTYDSDQEILAAIEAGATGYLLKDAPTDELTAAIRAAAAGQVALGPSVQRRLLGRMRAPGVSLSLRELEVLGLVSQGLSNDEVARELFLSRATVKSHLVHVYEKLGVDSRTAAVAEARRQGLLRD